MIIVRIHGKTFAKVRSLGLAKQSKEEMEKKLEKKRAERELKRSQIETKKKEKAEVKKLQEEKKQLKEMKKSSKVEKVEAASKETITPTVEAAAASFLTGTDGAYQSRPQFQSRLPTPRIYWRAEIAKREEARRVRQLQKVEPSIEAAPKEQIVPTVEAPAVSVTAEASFNGTVAAYQSLPEVEAEKSELYRLSPRLVKKLDGTKEGGLDLFRKNEEARRSERECMRAELVKKRKKEEEEERKKQEEKKMEEERKLAKGIDDGFKSVSKAIREAKKSVLKKPSRSVVKKMALQSGPESDSIKKAIGTREARRCEMKCVGLEKSWGELEAEISDLLRRRAEICEWLRAENEKKREMEEERIKRALESDSESESASPTRVLEGRVAFGCDESSSGSESDDDLSFESD